MEYQPLSSTDLRKSLRSIKSIALHALGPLGSNSHIAANEIATLMDNRCLLIPQFHPTIEDVLRTVEQSDELGIVPIYNVVGGDVALRNNTLVRHEVERLHLSVLHIAQLAISHCVYVQASETILRAGSPIYSHPQALTQCTNYTMRHNLSQNPTNSTAEAAHMLAQGELPEYSAVIASPMARELYNITMIATDVGNLKSDKNITNMAVIRREGHTTA